MNFIKSVSYLLHVKFLGGFVHDVSNFILEVVQVESQKVVKCRWVVHNKSYLCGIFRKINVTKTLNYTLHVV